MGRGRGKYQTKRERMWYEQAGLCYWCGDPMVWRDFGEHEKMMRNDCTIEHLDDRQSPHRGLMPKAVRIVLAHHQCNHERGILSHGESQRVGPLSHFYEFNPHTPSFITTALED